MEQNLIKSEIESRIFIIRGKQVMFDRDLARLYNVQTRVLNQTVKRNANRFPEQFMFQLTSEEFDNWKSHIVTSNSEKMGLRKLPYVFNLGASLKDLGKRWFAFSIPIAIGRVDSCLKYSHIFMIRKSQTFAKHSPEGHSS
jgi:hypothetical protein